jgi:Tfp pilus assembly protein PilN
MKLGIELDAGVIRAVRIQKGAGSLTRVVEAHWDPEQPEEAVQTIRDNFGSARHVAVAIGLPLLLVKRVQLPPVPAADRAAILQLEPQRFFAIRLEDLIASVRDEDDLVFAAREAPLTQWLTALRQLGPIHRVEPAPLALARALAGHSIRDAVVLLDGSDAGSGVGLVEIRDGRVAQVRRLYGQLADAAVALGGNGQPAATRILVTPWNDERGRMLATRLPAASVEPLPSFGEMAGSFLPAYGAALGTERPLVGALMPDQLRSEIGRRRRRDLVFAAVAAVLAVVFAITSVSVRKDRSAREIESRVAALSAPAAQALALQTQLETLNRQAGAIQRVEAQRADPLALLLALSKHLPADAYLRSLRIGAGEWQIEGYATQAAQLIQVLGDVPEFRNVHFLSATNRIQVDERSYETFSLAFRFIPAP